MSEELHKEIKKNYIMTLLEKKERVDGRTFTDYREISVQPGVVETAEGSALARIGKTQIIAGYTPLLLTIQMSELGYYCL